MHEAVIELKNLTKSFGSVKANDHIGLSIQKGKIMALVGENGAGKTTLMKLLFGLLRPDSGQIFIQGKQITPQSPADTISLGIGMVHQHFMLVPPFTVTENVILGTEPRQYKIFINLKSSLASLKDVSDRYGFTLDPNAKIETLGVGIEQRVEIIKTLYRNASILILDEPTAVLTPQETDELFDMLRQFKSEGKTIIFISHKLDEVLAISDQITVMRAGKVTGQLKTAETTKEEIAKLMVGREVILRVPKNKAKPGEEVLVLHDVHVRNTRKQEVVKGISLQVRQGEILGIAGVEGNGQTELAEAITGLRAVINGEITLRGNRIDGKSPRQISEAGLAHIPEDRLQRGLVTDFTLQENLMLGRHQDSRFFTKYGLAKEAVMNKELTRLVEDYDIRPAELNLLGRQFSGGNQQKIIVARELSKEPGCLVAVQPTRGVDIGAIEFIHHQIISARDEGVAVLLISADLAEILSLSDRIAVIFNGKIMGILDASQAEERKIGLMMTGTPLAATA
jgi:simple sugar transport system ATP-binding protein